MTENNIVVPVGRAPVAPTVAPLTAPGVYAATPRSALGGRDVEAHAAFDFAVLRVACMNPNVLPNPAHSTGCSPLLRELLQQIGLAYQVTREVFDDGNAAGHLGGNALDITSTDLADLARVFRQVPDLFETCAYQSEYPAESLFILAGTLVDAGALPGLVDAGGASLHLSSSLPRLLIALHGTAIAALPAAVAGQFSSRDVYAVRQPVSLTGAATGGVRFW